MVKVYSFLFGLALIALSFVGAGHYTEEKTLSTRIFPPDTQQELAGDAHAPAADERNPFSFNLTCRYPSKLKANESSLIQLSYTWESRENDEGDKTELRPWSVTLQAPAFDFSPAKITKSVEQLGSDFAWAISPKSGKVGTQTVVIDFTDGYFFDPATIPNLREINWTLNSKAQDTPVEKIVLNIDVLTEDGIPHWLARVLFYLVTVLGAFLMFPLVKNWILFLFGPPDRESDD